MHDTICNDLPSLTRLNQHKDEADVRTDCSGKVGLLPHTVKYSGKVSSIGSSQLYFPLAGTQSNTKCTPLGVNERP